MRTKLLSPWYWLCTCRQVIKSLFLFFGLDLGRTGWLSITTLLFYVPGRCRQFWRADNGLSESKSHENDVIHILFFFFKKIKSQRNQFICCAFLTLLSNYRRKMINIIKISHSSRGSPEPLRHCIYIML